MTIFNRDQAQPFTSADGSTIREFLNAGNSALKNQSLAEATLEPGQATAAHFHPVAEEIYFITSGSGVMRIGSETRKVGVGDAIAIPNGQIHKIWNDGTAKLVFLCCCAPPYSHEDTVLTAEIAPSIPDAL